MKQDTIEAPSLGTNIKQKSLFQKTFIQVPLDWRYRIKRTTNVAESFYHAFRGISCALSSQRNLRFHCLSALGALTLAFYLGFDPVSWAILILTIGLVIACELLNTAIEQVVDLTVQDTFHSLARDAKDISAGAVAIVSLVALSIGITLFIPRLWSVFFHSSSGLFRL